MWNFCPPVILQIGPLAGKSAPLQALNQSSTAWGTLLNFFIFLFVVSLLCSAGKIALFFHKVETADDKLNSLHTITFFSLHSNPVSIFMSRCSYSHAFGSLKGKILVIFVAYAPTCISVCEHSTSGRVNVQTD